MTDRPLIFTGESVRGLLDGSKTMTRRLVKWPKAAFAHGRRPAPDHSFLDRGLGAGCYMHCAYTGGDLGDEVLSLRVHPPIAVGDRVWVKETWRTEELPDNGQDGIRFRADGHFQPIENTMLAATAWVAAHDSGRHPKWRSPLYMPRWASRITLPVVSVRAERVQDITEEDARAEGVNPNDAALVFDSGNARFVPDLALTHRGAFACHWDRINGKRAPWSDNHWVWVYGFGTAEVNCG